MEIYFSVFFSFVLTKVAHIELTVYDQPPATRPAKQLPKDQTLSAESRKVKLIVTILRGFIAAAPVGRWGV